MQLYSFEVKNFKSIGNDGCQIYIDEIVVLVGSNNAGKSTILDAYEVFASQGSPQPIDFFHKNDEGKAIEITGTFTAITEDDKKLIGGEKWIYKIEGQEYLKAKWIWKKPNEKGIKYAFNSEDNLFIEGGFGGFDSLLQSVIPKPIRIKPTDSPEQAQSKILEILKSHIKSKLSEKNKEIQEIFNKIDELTNQFSLTSKETIDQITSEISRNIENIFPKTIINLIPKSKNNLDEKIIGSESYLEISFPNSFSTPLISQGSGLQRSLLWSALASIGNQSKSTKSSKSKSPTPVEKSSKILLIDEPEAFLHPPTIRGAREALYNFAIENDEWQVIATTHSPIFIDLSKKHTTIIRVDPKKTPGHFVRTDSIGFSTEEKEQLRILRECNPMVNEFFFYDEVILVEGPTEQIALQKICESENIQAHIINCMGKANIPIFCKILNQFKIKYLVIHDSDSKFAKRKNKQIHNPMWSLNAKIRESANINPLASIFTQVPNFEGEFFETSLSNGKVDNILESIKKNDEEFTNIKNVYLSIIKRDSSFLTSSLDSFDKKIFQYLSKGSYSPELWELEAIKAMDAADKGKLSPQDSL